VPFRLPPGRHGAQVGRGLLGQGVGAVHQHVFHHFAHAGFDLGQKHAKDEHRRDAADEEKAEQQPQAQVHVRPGWRAVQSPARP
jgi:hypothetical protein